MYAFLGSLEIAKSRKNGSASLDSMFKTQAKIEHGPREKFLETQVS